MHCVRSEVLTVVLLKVQALWDVTLCRQASNSFSFQEHTAFAFMVKQSLPELYPLSHSSHAG